VKLRWSLRAHRDIEKIYHYVAADKPEAARRLAERAGNELASHPYLGRIARPGDLRELIVGSYLLVYRVRDVIEIVTVVHGARRRTRGGN